MNDFLPSTDELAQQPIYYYSHDDEKFIGSISVRKGIVAESVARVDFATAKISDVQVNNFKLVKQMLQPHQRGGLKEPDVEGNLTAVEEQNLFLSMLMDRLNNQDCIVERKGMTRITLTKESMSQSTIHEFVSDEVRKSFEESFKKDYNFRVPAFTLRRNDGTGNYQEFIKITCAPENKDLFEKAIIDTIFIFDRAQAHVMAQRHDTQKPKPPDGSTLG